MGNVIEYTEEMVGAKHPTKADTLNRAIMTNHSSVGKHTDVQLVSTGRISSSGGSFELTLAGTTAVILDTSGGMRIPIQPAFCVTASSSQLNLPNATTMISFPSSYYRFDQNSDFSTDTFTAPVTGRYLLTWGLRILFIESTADFYRALLITSNQTYGAPMFDTRGFTSGTGTLFVGGSIVADLDALDTAYVSHQLAGGGGGSAIHKNSYFSGVLVA